TRGRSWRSSASSFAARAFRRSWRHTTRCSSTSQTASSSCETAKRSRPNVRGSILGRFRSKSHCGLDVSSRGTGQREASMALRLPQRDLVTEVDDLWIPLPDGGRLSAHLWLPPGADAAPVPAIVEVSPYRHEDHTRRRDAVRHPYFAENGYASLRVDIRGSG